MVTVFPSCRTNAPLPLQYLGSKITAVRPGGAIYLVQPSLYNGKDLHHSLLIASEISLKVLMSISELNYYYLRLVSVSCHHCSVKDVNTVVNIVTINPPSSVDCNKTGRELEQQDEPGQSWMSGELQQPSCPAGGRGDKYRVPGCQAICRPAGLQPDTAAGQHHRTAPYSALGWARLGWARQCWAGLESAGTDRAGLSNAGLGWTGLDRTGLD